MTELFPSASEEEIRARREQHMKDCKHLEWVISARYGDEMKNGPRFVKTCTECGKMKAGWDQKIKTNDIFNHVTRNDTWMSYSRRLQ